MKLIHAKKENCSSILVSCDYSTLNYKCKSVIMEESPSTTLSDSFTHTHTVTLTFKREKNPFSNSLHQLTLTLNTSHSHSKKNIYKTVRQY